MKMKLVASAVKRCFMPIQIGYSWIMPLSAWPHGTQNAFLVRAPLTAGTYRGIK